MFLAHCCKLLLRSAARLIHERLHYSLFHVHGRIWQALCYVCKLSLIMGNFVSSRSAEEEVEMADGNSQLALLDLSFLSEEEREKIERVLKADQEIRTKDRVRLG